MKHKIFSLLIILIFAFHLFAGFGYGQITNFKVAKDTIKGNGDDDTDTDTETELPPFYFNVEIPPSPIASTFKNYTQSVSVNLSTGTPNLSIPIFSLANSKHSQSVSISYSSNGVEVDKLLNYGQLGIDWNLNAGGVINRTLNGNCDENTDGFLYSFNYTDIENMNDAGMGSDQLFNIINGNYDGEPDLFSFSFGAYSGKFYLIPKKEDGNQFTGNDLVSEYNVIMASKSNLRIIPEHTNNYGLTKFTIYTPEGTKYIFDKIESTTIKHPKTATFSYSSAWFLTKIISQEGNVEFEFTYNSYERTYDKTWFYYAIYSKMLYDIPGSDGDDLGRPSSSLNSDASERIVNTWLIDTIIGKNGKIIFERNGDEIITGIKTQDLNTAGERKYNFIYSYASGLLLLNGLYESNTNNESIPPYIFEYFQDENLYNIITATDLWGFYNGQGNYYNPVPKIKVIVDAGFDNTYVQDKTFKKEKAKIGLLHTIHFPPGGHTEIEYEPHNFTCQNSWNTQFVNYYNSPNIEGAGFRVKSFKVYDSNTKLIKEKQFRYFNGKMASEPYFYNSRYNYIGHTETNSQRIFYQREHISVNSTVPYGSTNGSIVSYDKVIEKDIGEKQNGQITHYFLNEQDIKYNSIEPGDPISMIHYVDNSRNRGVDTLTVFEKFYNGNYETIKEVQTEYKNIYFDKIYGLKAKKNKSGGLGTSIVIEPVLTQLYSQNRYTLSSYWKPVVISQTVKSYIHTDNFGGDERTNEPIVEKKTYTYKNATLVRENDIQLLDEIKKTVNNDILYRYKYTYPTDYSGNFINAMKEAYIIEAPIENLKYKNTDNSLLIAGVYTKYENTDNANIQAKELYATENLTPIDYTPSTTYPPTNNMYKPKSKIIKYDNLGNVLQYKKKDDIMTSLIWGYNKTHPVININGENIEYDDISSIIDMNNLNTSVEVATATTSIRNYYLNDNYVFIKSNTFNKFNMVGTETDINNRTTYYKYDNFGRLETILDQDGKIIKQIEYNYKQIEYK